MALQIIEPEKINILLKLFQENKKCQGSERKFIFEMGECPRFILSFKQKEQDGGLTIVLGFSCFDEAIRYFKNDG